MANWHGLKKSNLSDFLRAGKMANSREIKKKHPLPRDRTYHPAREENRARQLNPNNDTY